MVLTFFELVLSMSYIRLCQTKEYQPKLFVSCLSTDLMVSLGHYLKKPRRYHGECCA